MEYRRTAVIKLDTPEGADAHLRETVEQFTYCANTASEWCWHGDDGYHVTSKAKAEDALYDQLREDTELTANLVQKGIRQAVEAVKSGVERLKNDQDTSRPTFTADTAIYDKRSATFYRDHVSLSTPDGRIECDYILPDCAGVPPTTYVTDEDYEFRRATLHRRDGDWYLHASMLKKDDDTDTTTGHRTVLGVDLGVNELAVASTGQFWSADEFNHWKREYEKRRGDLQQCGTRAAHDAIAGIERKEDGRFEIFLHRVANEIVAEAVEHDCSHIVFEDLTDIRENVPEASWHHLWAFRRLYEYVAYKAREQGVEAVQVDPRNTSKRCSTCGFTHDENRHGEDFECLDCGYQNHADYNAVARNLRFLAARQTASGDRQEHRATVSPASAKRRRRRRTRRRALESRDVEREWRVRPSRLIRGVEQESTRKPSPQRASGAIAPERSRGG